MWTRFVSRRAVAVWLSLAVAAHVGCSVADREFRQTTLGSGGGGGGGTGSGGYGEPLGACVVGESKIDHCTLAP